MTTATMNTYEAFIILKPILDVDNSDNVLKSLEDAIENLKGKVLKKEKQGRKRLAYEVKKFKDGFVTAYLLSMDPSTLESFKRTCQLNEDILRIMMVNRNKYNMNDPALTGRERPQRAGGRPGAPGGDAPPRERD